MCVVDHRGPDADRQDHLFADGEQRLRQGLLQAPDQDSDRLVRLALDEHGELVAAQSGHHGAGHTGHPQPLPHRGQDLISTDVPKRVIDRLEVVDVECDQPQGAALRPQPVQRPIQSIAQRRAVQQPGAGIEERIPRHGVLGRPPGSHVLDVNQELGDVRVAWSHLQGGCRDHDLSIDSHPGVEADLDLWAPSVLALRKDRFQPILVLGRDPGPQRTTQDLRQRQPHHSCERGVRGGDGRGPTGHPDPECGNRRTLEHRLEQHGGVGADLGFPLARRRRCGAPDNPAGQPEQSVHGDTRTGEPNRYPWAMSHPCARR